MIDRTKKLAARFYETAAGSEPVRLWLRSLSAEDRMIIGKDVAKVEFGWPIGMPYCRSLGGGLWEVRSDLSSNRTARVLFCIASGSMVLLHGFIKKSQQTPKPDLELGRRRMKEISK
jgi:phage-related protein